MTAYFWKPGGSPHFGVFHHDSGFGLMHLADPKELPGKKIWTYGYGRHRSWGQGSTEGGQSYVEMESGPLIDQGEKPLFPKGAEHRYEEFWIPVHSREACDLVEWPKLDLPPMAEPWLGWKHSAWQNEWEKFNVCDGPLPASPVPVGLELEDALRRSNAPEQLALWLAFRGRPREAISLVEKNPSPTAQRIAGLILWKALDDPSRAAGHLESGPLQDPLAAAELDELYTSLGLTFKRASLLANAPAHRFLVERRADLALTTGKPAECIRLLAGTSWPREHQRYARTELWRRAKAALGETDAAVPDSLNEDNLARFGAYWSD